MKRRNLMQATLMAFVVAACGGEQQEAQPGGFQTSPTTDAMPEAVTPEAPAGPGAQGTVGPGTGQDTTMAAPVTGQPGMEPGPADTADIRP